MKNLIVIAALSILLFGCSNQVPKTGSESEVKENGVNEVEVTEINKNNVEEENIVKETADIAIKEDTKTSGVVNEETETTEKEITVSAIFYGLADSTSVELGFEGQTDNFLFADFLYEKIDEIPYESKVEITYVENEGERKVIKEINVLE